MLELCMFAEGAQYQEEITAVGAQGKIECLVPGPGRFWPDHLGAAPTPQLIVSPRNPKGPEKRDIPVDPTRLEAGRFMKNPGNLQDQSGCFIVLDDDFGLTRIPIAYRGGDRSTEQHQSRGPLQIRLHVLHAV